jgi:RimJ/RimL family protein N-acetyltransferase
MSPRRRSSSRAEAVATLLDRGRRFRLRPVAAADLDYLRRLRNHPDTRRFLGDPRRISADGQRGWFRALQGDASRAYCILELHGPAGWIRLGMARLHDIDRRNRSMGVGGDIAPEERGKGYGRILYRLIFRLGFGRMRLNRLWLHVLAGNARALGLYRTLGFREVGRLRQAIRHGARYHDYVVMDLLKRELVAVSRKRAKR